MNIRRFTTTERRQGKCLGVIGLCDKLTRLIGAAGMQLFHEQAVTISKSGSHVVIQCENGDDANAVFDWLADIEENLWSAKTKSSSPLHQRQCECCGVPDTDAKRSPIWNNVMLCPYCFDQWYDNGLTKPSEIKPASLKQRASGQR